MAEETPKVVHFREGDFLSAAEAGEVVRSAPTSIVVVAGVAESGKTTLVAGLYGLFHKGPFAGYLFAGSRTLPGLERRCHLARMASGRQTPDTERTKHTNHQHLLHLRLALPSPLRHFDILFSDIYGEAFRRAADSAAECSKFLILKRADHVTILIDGEKAVSKTDRQEAFSSADALLGQCLDTGMLGTGSSVQAVVTKWDVVEKASPVDSAFVDSKLRWLTDRHGARLGHLSHHKVAIRPPGGGLIKAGFGIEPLLRLWLGICVPPKREPVRKSNSHFHTEFDRLIASWPAVGLPEGVANE
jgi:hypothetical protein